MALRAFEDDGLAKLIERDVGIDVVHRVLGPVEDHLEVRIDILKTS